MSPFVIEVQPATGRPLELSAMAALARRLTRRCFAELEHTPADETGRAYALIACGREHEAWLIRWDEGACIPLHDHGGVRGVLAVAKGRLLERVWDERQNREESRLLRSGRLVTFESTHVHGVENPYRSVAYSVHVYSPRLHTMHFYEREPRSRIRRVRTERFADYAAVSEG